MQQNIQPINCKKCRGLCQMLPVKSNPEASEHYCERCHKSYPMYEQNADGHLVPAT